MRWMIGLWVAGIVVGVLASLAFRQFAYNRPAHGKYGAVDPAYAAAISTARASSDNLALATPSPETTAPASATRVHQPTPAPPSPVTLSGSGTVVTEAVTLEPGLVIVTSLHQGTGRFQVTLFDNDGKQLGRPASGSGSWQGSSSVFVPDDGLYLFEVIADGDWTIEAKHPIADPATSFKIPFTQTGSGYQALYFLSLPTGTHRLTAACDTDSLRVTTVDLDGTFRRMLLDTSCPFDGTVAVPIATQQHGLFVVDVATQGSWTVSIE